MSNYYFIVNEEGKEYFECGKNWVIDDPLIVYSADDLYENLVKYKLGDYAGTEEEIKTYFRKIADEISKWCNGKKVDVMDENVFGDRYYFENCKLTMTGSIYEYKFVDQEIGIWMKKY